MPQILSTSTQANGLSFKKLIRILARWFVKYTYECGQLVLVFQQKMIFGERINPFLFVVTIYSFKMCKGATYTTCSLRTHTQSSEVLIYHLLSVCVCVRIWITGQFQIIHIFPVDLPCLRKTLVFLFLLANNDLVISNDLHPGSLYSHRTWSLGPIGLLLHGTLSCLLPWAHWLFDLLIQTVYFPLRHTGKLCTLL